MASMSYKFTLTFFFLCFFVFSELPAQQKSVSKKAKLKQNRLVVVDDPTITTANFFSQYADQMGLNTNTEFQLLQSIEGVNGMQHHKFQQFYQAVPVFGSVYVLHEKAGQVKSASGYYLPALDLDVRPTIGEEEALSYAMQKMNATEYMWESDHLSSLAEIHERPRPELCIIDAAFPDVSEQEVLAYKVELFSAEPYDRQQYFIDANNGTVLLQLPLLHDQGVPAVGVTRYYGEQNIIVDSIAPNEFHLHDPTRGEGITTYAGDNSSIVSHEDTYWDLTNPEMHEVAIDGHYCATEFYDYLLETFDWDGLGNNGEAMLTVVNGGNFVNAFWNGTYALFGDGNCNAGPLTTLEVVAHEFTHGLTDYTSDLIYSGESGAINESMSDVFGKALEFHVDPDNFEWTIGRSFLETQFARPFRSMEDPHIYEHPKFYKGEFWTDGAGVHTNSSVGNHWFYSLVTGGSGVNQAGEPYSIDPLPMEQAIQVSFLLQKAYLTPNSTYPIMHEASILAAKELFGEQAPEVESVIQAWKKVGLPYVQTEEILDLVAQFDGFIDYTCLNGEYYPFEITVTNVGGLPFVPSMNGGIEIDGDVVQFLETALMPGETITYLIEDYLFIDENGSTSIFSKLIIEEETENDQNNNDYLLVINSLYEDNELELNYAGLSAPNCFDDERTLSLSIRNYSCNFLPAGAMVTAKLTNAISGLEEELVVEIPTGLFTNQLYYTNESVNIPQTETGELLVELIFPGDNDLTNNDRNILLPPVKSVLEGDYDMDFSETNFSIDEIIRTGLNSPPIIEYQGESYFAATGFSPNFQATLCADAADNFNSFIREGFNICASLQEDVPYLMEFDLIQFRNPESAIFPELGDFTSMLKVRWEDAVTGQSDEIIIQGQVEGELVHHTMDLPMDFKGQIFFEFLNISGNFNDENFLDYDVSLLDNLQITELIVSTENPALTPLDIRPNPTNDVIYIQHSEQPERLVLRNIYGQEVLVVNKDQDMNQLDLSNLPNAYYLLTVDYANQVTLTQPVVKVGN